MSNLSNNKANNQYYSYTANIPMIIQGCPFLNSSEKVLMGLLINQSNTFKKSKEFSIKQERLLFYMAIQKRALLKIVREKLIPKGFIIDFKENSGNFDVIISDFIKNPFIMITSKVFELLQPKRKLFKSKEENKIWTIFSKLKIDDIPTSLKTYDEAEDFVRNILTSKGISIKTGDDSYRPKYDLGNVNKWYLSELSSYFYDEYEKIVGLPHPPLKNELSEELIYKVWKNYSTEFALNVKKHIDKFLEIYSKKDGYNPKLQLLGNLENIYQVDFYLQYGCLPADYNTTKDKTKNSYYTDY